MPLTVLRIEAPLGEGSLQQFVDADFEQHYFTLYEGDEHREQLQALCVFDLLANSTDRKSGIACSARTAASTPSTTG